MDEFVFVFPEDALPSVTDYPLNPSSYPEPYSSRPSSKLPNYGFGFREEGPPLDSETLGLPWNLGANPQQIFHWNRIDGANNSFGSEMQFKSFRNSALGSDPRLLMRGWYQIPDNYPFFVETYVATSPVQANNGVNYYPTVSQIGNEAHLNYSAQPTGYPIISEWTSIYKLDYMFNIWDW